MKQTDITKAFANIKMSFSMEWLNVTDEIQDLCLSIVRKKHLMSA